MDRTRKTMLLAGLCAAASLAVAGCGNGGSATDKIPIPPPPANITASGSPNVRDLTGTADTKDSCDAKGIDTSSLREGTCLGPADQFYTVVNRRHTLRLDQLDVTVVSTRFTRTLGHYVQHTGLFYLVDVRVKNKTGSAVAFDPQQRQTRLLMGDPSYGSALHALYVPGVSFPIADDSIRPGRSRTGTLVFSVPAMLEKLERNRSRGPELSIINFSDIGKSHPPTIGQIRLYV